MKRCVNKPRIFFVNTYPEKREMKVVHINWTLVYGGIETMLVNIANEQAVQGTDVSVVIINDYIKEELTERLSSDINLILMKRKPSSRSFAFIKKLNSILTDIDPDVIHIHDGAIFDVLDSHWAKSRQTLVCLTAHALPIGKFGSPLWPIRILQKMLSNSLGNMHNVNRVNKVFAISKSVAKAMKEQYGVDSAVVCNGIIPQRFEQRESKMYDEQLRIVQVSRLFHVEKGQDLLLGAARILAQEGCCLKIDFIGDGQSREYLENMAREYGLENQVTFLGTQSQEYVMSHLKDYDLFVQPSRFEGFGLTVAEAMAANVPVLVPTGQGPAEVTEGDRYGWVFDCGDENSLANQIKNIINNYGECTAKAEKARIYVEANYDVKVTAHRYLELYNEALNIKLHP